MIVKPDGENLMLRNLTLVAAVGAALAMPADAMARGHGGGGHGGGPHGGGPHGGGHHGGGHPGGGRHGGGRVGGGHQGSAGQVHGQRYEWGGEWYCWYANGWSGPGWYVCGANW